MKRILLQGGRIIDPASGLDAVGDVAVVGNQIESIGPLARAVGGIDLSWIVGLAVTSPVYYWLGKRSQNRRAVSTMNAPQLST
jgi:purine-cytosine permease-like protein